MKGEREREKVKQSNERREGERKGEGGGDVMRRRNYGDNNRQKNLPTRKKQIEEMKGGEERISRN